MRQVCNSKYRVFLLYCIRHVAGTSCLPRVEPPNLTGAPAKTFYLSFRPTPLYPQSTQSCPCCGQAHQRPHRLSRFLFLSCHVTALAGCVWSSTLFPSLDISLECLQASPPNLSPLLAPILHSRHFCPPTCRLVTSKLCNRPHSCEGE